MTHPARSPARRALRAAMAISGIALLVASCAPVAPGGITDPYEDRNREVHEENVRVDRAFIRPVARGYAQVVPAPVRTGLANASSNLGLPGTVLNDLLQLRPGDALANTTRFAINSTIGIAGLFDPAGAMGLPERPADFGETLHVWGAREGAYLELPLLGPSTERDAVGRVVDIALNPTRMLIDDGRALRVGLGVASGLELRNQLGPVLDPVLDDSADSYAQTRIGYLQYRRFMLGKGSSSDYLDPYEELYGDGF